MCRSKDSGVAQTRFALSTFTLCLRQVRDYAESTPTEPLAEWIANFDIGIVPDPA